MVANASALVFTSIHGLESSLDLTAGIKFVTAPEQNFGPFPCEPVVEVDRPAGYVPHHLPGTNPFLREFAEKYKLPVEAVRGGAETMYPEYQLRLVQSSRGTEQRTGRP